MIAFWALAAGMTAAALAFILVPLLRPRAARGPSMEDANLEVLGFATQAAFLLANGIEQLAGAATNDVERVRLAGEARRLMMPGEMGESFKVMALGRDYEAPLSGFAVQDLRRLL